MIQQSGKITVVFSCLKKNFPNYLDNFNHDFVIQ